MSEDVDPEELRVDLTLRAKVDFVRGKAIGPRTGRAHVAKYIVD